jgi:hypothetical protein
MLTPTRAARSVWAHKPAERIGVETKVGLDIIAAVEGSDKASSVRAGWDYMRSYETAFAEYRDQPINMIEIGVARGPSLKAWSWYFSQAQIIGVDIKPECAVHAGGRVHIEIGSQTDGAFLDRICKKYPPTIIIDDGSHHADHIMFTFERMFLQLPPGGIYVVEDLALHFGEKGRQTRVSMNGDAPGYFLSLARDVMSRFGRSEKLLSENPHKYAKKVDSVQFIGSAAIIRRRREGRDTDAAVTAAEAYLGTMPEDATRLGRMVEYILINKGPIDRANLALDRAMAVDGATPYLLMLRARVLTALAEHEKALPVMAQAAAMPGLAPNSKLSLARLYEMRGDLETALRLAEQAQSEQPGPAYMSTVRRLRQAIATGAQSPDAVVAEDF